MIEENALRLNLRGKSQRYSLSQILNLVSIKHAQNSSLCLGEWLLSELKVHPGTFYFSAPLEPLSIRTKTGEGSKPRVQFAGKSGQRDRIIYITVEIPWSGTIFRGWWTRSSLRRSSLWYRASDGEIAASLLVCHVLMAVSRLNAGLALGLYPANAMDPVSISNSARRESLPREPSNFPRAFIAGNPISRIFPDSCMCHDVTTAEKVTASGSKGCLRVARDKRMVAASSLWPFASFRHRCDFWENWHAIISCFVVHSWR